MKPTIIALAKALGLGFLALAVLSICTELASRLSTFDVGPFLLLLFVVYPLAALLLGAEFALAGVKVWAPLLVTPALYLVIVAVWYNDTALVYVAAYTLASLAAYAVAYALRRTRQSAA